jgi:phospholipase D-like protein
LEWSRDELYAGIRSAENEILIVSPFITREIARQVAQRAGASKAKTLRLLTCLSPAATTAGVLDRDALLDFLGAGWDLRTGRNLHAKVALVDREWGLLGSGNLTTKGLGGEEIKGNAELGVVLATAQVARAHRIASKWWKEAKPIDQAMIEACPPKSRGGTGKRSAVGPDLGSKPKHSEDRPPRGHTGFWLKMVYDAEERRGLEWWTRQDWLSDRHLLREGKRPILQPTYREGDLLVLYVVGRGCPAIVEVTRTAEFEPKLVQEDPGSRPDDWRRWGWVTKIACRHSVPLDKAPTLGDIDVATSSVKRHGRIRLSPEQFALARSELLRR